MKKIVVALFFMSSIGLNAQIKTPALSPLSKVEQTIGLTNITVEYSRPSKREREVFPEVAAYGQIWRAGANKNSIVSISDQIIIGKDTLKAGSYAIFVKPEKNNWTVYLYSNTENWGTPAKWDEKLVAAAITVPTIALNHVVETFTIGFDNITLNSGNLVMSWDKVMTVVPFKVNDAKKINDQILKVLAGPTANDFYRAADYNINSNGDMKQALQWIDKAIELYGKDVPFHVLRKKAIIQAELVDYKGAIETAKKSIDASKAAGNDEYVRMNEASIKEWSKK